MEIIFDTAIDLGQLGQPQAEVTAWVTTGEQYNYDVTIDKVTIIICGKELDITAYLTPAVTDGMADEAIALFQSCYKEAAKLYRFRELA